MRARTRRVQWLLAAVLFIASQVRVLSPDEIPVECSEHVVCLFVR